MITSSWDTVWIALQNGKKARRRNWHRMKYVFLNGKLVMCCYRGKIAPYNSDFADLYERDWIIFD